MSFKKIDNCPRCEAELERGLLSDTANIFWHPEGTKKTFLNRIFGKRLCPTNDGVGSRNVKAQLCRNCGLVLFTGKRIRERGRRAGL